MKKLHKSFDGLSKSMTKELARIDKCHKIWHQFSGWLIKTYGADLFGEWQEFIVGDVSTKYRSFNDLEFSRRIVGYDVMKKIENYVNRYCKDIVIIHCDDSVYASSIILLIPHPKHGITVMYIPQCTDVQNQFFLYKSHYQQLRDGLSKLSKICYK